MRFYCREGFNGDAEGDGGGGVSEGGGFGFSFEGEYCGGFGVGEAAEEEEGFAGPLVVDCGGGVGREDGWRGRLAREEFEGILSGRRKTTMWFMFAASSSMNMNLYSSTLYD